jgi:hypothetical protein
MGKPFVIGSKKEVKKWLKHTNLTFQSSRKKK